ncbi:hypothetical protein ACEPAG_1165 [Sanghuangporus baumii]
MSSISTPILPSAIQQGILADYDDGGVGWTNKVAKSHSGLILVTVSGPRRVFTDALTLSLTITSSVSVGTLSPRHPFSSFSNASRRETFTGKSMSSSVASPDSIHPCRWDWCRQVFDTSDRLAKHVLDDHVANEIPVKREDIRLELRAFDGTSIGEDSIRTSLLMNDSAFLHDEEKENDLPLPKNGHSVHNSNHQGVVNGSEEDIRIDSDPAPVALGGVEGVFSSDQSHDHRSSDTFQAASSPSPTSRSFGALTAASSPSPDPDSMAVARSPSLAEMVAKTINSVYSAQHVGEAGPSTIKPAAGLRQSRSPSSGRTEEPDHLPTTGKRKSAEPQMSENLRPPSRTGSRPLSSHSHRTDRSRSRSAPNLPHRDTSSSSQAVVEPVLSSIPKAADASVLQNGLRTDTQTSDVVTTTVRPFRTGSIRLEPNLPVGETADAEPPQGDTATQSPPHADLRARDAHPQEPDKPFEGANSYIDDIDVLSSSLDPSIPAFTQAFDVQNQSLWPLATQAPYSFDSQLAFSSQ